MMLRYFLSIRVNWIRTLYIAERNKISLVSLVLERRCLQITSEMIHSTVLFFYTRIVTNIITTYLSETYIGFRLFRKIQFVLYVFVCVGLFFYFRNSILLLPDVVCRFEKRTAERKIK